MAITHLIFDTETLGKKPSSVTLSLACVAFTFEEDKSFSDYVAEGFQVKFSPIEQLKVYKRTVEQDTIAWWKEQGEDAKKVMNPSPNDSLLLDGLTDLDAYIASSNYKQNSGSFVWSRGNYFDGPILDSLYSHFPGYKIPFNTWKWRDTRTFMDMFLGSSDGFGRLKHINEPSMIKHNALHDVCADIVRMKILFREFYEQS